jgi:hypothetical protein
MAPESYMRSSAAMMIIITIATAATTPSFLFPGPPQALKQSKTSTLTRENLNKKTEAAKKNKKKRESQKKNKERGKRIQKERAGTTIRQWRKQNHHRLAKNEKGKLPKRPPPQKKKKRRKEKKICTTMF